MWIVNHIIDAFLRVTLNCSASITSQPNLLGNDKTHILTHMYKFQIQLDIQTLLILLEFHNKIKNWPISLFP